MSQTECKVRRAVIFVPDCLQSRSKVRSEEEKHEEPILLLGWCVYGDPFGESVFAVIAGTTTKVVAAKRKLASCYSILGPEQHCILGTLDERNDDDNLARKGSEDSLCIALERRSCSKLVIKALRIPGAELRCAPTLIRYPLPHPNRMRYLALEPMILPLAAPSKESAQEATEVERSRSARQEQQRRLEDLILLDPVRHADLKHNYAKGRSPGEGFRTAIHLINGASYLLDQITSSGSRYEGNERQTNGQLRRMISLLWRPCHVCVHVARDILHVELNNVSLVSLSASARQLSLRFGQLLVWPSLGQQLRVMRLHDNEPIAILAPRYTALYNGVWLVANDLIMGQAAGALLCDNSARVASLFYTHVRPSLVSLNIEALRWLDSWPLGVKLNTPLSRFLCDMFVGLTRLWSTYGLATLDDKHVVEQVVYGAGMMTRIFGLSMLLCLCIDAVRLLCIHFTMFYVIQQTTFSFFCSSLASLFHLFRGKKRNPLRNMRVDHATYDLDQLLLGTLFFTVLSFLWVTVATYYAYFACLRLAQRVFIAAVQALLATVNHLPLFALMLRLKDPSRLPGGIAFSEWQTSCIGVDGTPFATARLTSTYLSFTDIFRGHHRHLEGIRALPRLALNVLIGKYI